MMMLVYYTASSAFAVNNFYTSSITQSITSSTVNNTINNSTINQTIISSSVNNVAPSDQYVQYNSASAFGASISFQYVYPSESLQHGSGPSALGNYSHAEGKDTRSTGGASHAEGFGTLASGLYSHAEGYFTTASAELSHAEGWQTKAIGHHSHAEGNGARATESGSHAEGASTQAIANASHAEGGVTVAAGGFSHAEGYQTRTSGIASHAEGHLSIALGNYSHAEGYATTASADYSHTNGLGTTAGGTYQHIAGAYNLSSANASAFIVGNGTNNASRSNLIFASGSTFQVTGSVALTQNLTVGGGYRPNTRQTDSALDPTLLVTDHVVFVAPSSPGGIIYLPASPVANMQIVIMRTELTPSFTVQPLGGFLINGLSSYAFPNTAFTRKTFTFFGSRWWVDSN